MIYLLWAIIFFVMLILQGTISFLHIHLNLTVLLVYYIGIKKKEVKGLLFGACIGIIEDSLSGAFLGPNLLSKGLVGYFSSFIYKRFFIWTPLLGVISVCAFTMLDSGIVFLSRTMFDSMPVPLGNAAYIIVMQSLLNSLFGMAIKPRDLQKDEVN